MNDAPYVVYAGETNVPIDLAHEGAFHWLNEYFGNLEQKNSRKWTGHAMYRRWSPNVHTGSSDEVRIDLWEYEDGNTIYSVPGGHESDDKYGLPSVGPQYQEDKEMSTTLMQYIDKAADRAGGTEDIDLLNI